MAFATNSSLLSGHNPSTPTACRLTPPYGVTILFFYYKFKFFFFFFLSLILQLLSQITVLRG
jgi:hypothetical protein